MNFGPPFIGVFDKNDVSSFKWNSDKNCGFKTIHDVLLNLGRDEIFRGETQHPAAVTPLEWECVNNFGDRLGITTQDLGFRRARLGRPAARDRRTREERGEEQLSR